MLKSHGGKVGTTTQVWKEKFVGNNKESEDAVASSLNQGEIQIVWALCRSDIATCVETLVIRTWGDSGE